MIDKKLRMDFRNVCSTYMDRSWYSTGTIDGGKTYRVNFPFKAYHYKKFKDIPNLDKYRAEAEAIASKVAKHFPECFVTYNLHTAACLYISLRLTPKVG